MVYSIPLIFSRGNPHGLHNCFHFVPWNSVHFWMMYMLLKVQIFLLSCIPANFWQHTIVITRGNKAGFILPPKQQWKCQNNFKWPAENSFLLHPLNLPSKRPHEGQRIPYCQPWHSGSKKTRISTQLKQPILHKVVTKRILSFSLRQGKILHDQSWSEFLLPIQTLKPKVNHPAYQKLMADNFVHQLKTILQFSWKL